MRSWLALAVGAVVWSSAAGVAASPRVFVRGFRGPQGGEIKAAVAGAIRGAVEVVGSARGADAIVDGSVDKKGLNWVLSVTVRDGGGKAVGGRSYPMPAPRVDRSTAEKLRRDIPGLAARAGKAGGAAVAKAEPEAKTAKPAKAPPPKKVAKVKASDDDKPRKGGKRSAADEADDDDEKPRKGGRRSAADEADDGDKPRKETAAQRRAREKREKAEKAAQAKRDKAEKAAQAKRDKEEKAAAARRGKGKDREEPTVRGLVRQSDDDEATDVVGPKDKRADAKAAKARKEQAAREAKARRLAEESAKLQRIQAEAKRQREEEQRRKEEEAAARRAEERRAREQRDAERRAEERRARQERDEARRAKLADEDERRAEARRARDAERKSREEEEARRAEARRGKGRRDADDDDDRRARRRDDDRAGEERDTGRRAARRAEADDDADARRRPGRDDDDAPRRGATRDDDDAPRRAGLEPREERTVRKAPNRPAVPGRGPANLAAGVVLSTRHFELSPKGQKLPVYDASFFPAVSLEGELFPLALAGVNAGKDLGVFLRYDRVVGLTSQETDQDETSPTFGQTSNFNNQAQKVEGGLVYRLHTGAAGLAPVVRPMVAIGYQTFTVGAKSSMPETAYTYVALGLGFYVPIGHPNFGAISTVRYHIVVGLGQVGGFGSAWTAWGVDLTVGLRLFIIRSLEVSATYLYERVEMTFQGLGPLSSDRGITPPSAGSDVYQGGRITVSYHF